MTQRGFTFDVNKCTGCSACQIACAIENQLDPQMSWRQVSTFNPLRYPDIPVFHHSLACNHCLDPPCMRHCPALAFSKDPVTGAVTIDPQKCVGCKYCAWACPYDAPQFNGTTGVMEKCTFCNHRLEVGLAPACVALCPTGALESRVYDEDTGDQVVLGLPRANVGPAIEIVPLEKNRVCPRMTDASKTAEIPHPSDNGGVEGRTATVTLRTEWTLVTFSLIAAWLVGGLGASTTSSFSAGPALFISAGVGAMLVSSLHLGRRTRAHRAILNWRDSWVSREILFFTMFLALGSVFLIVVPSKEVVGWTAIVMGTAALFAIDRIYGVTGTRGLNWHSGRVLLTGIFAWGVLSGNVVLAMTTGAIKLFLYSIRKFSSGRDGGGSRALWSVVRVVIGLVIPGAVWLFGSRDLFVYAGMGAFAGEVVDRCEYYLDLDIATPRKQMALDLTRYLRRRGITAA